MSARLKRYLLGRGRGGRVEEWERGGRGAREEREKRERNGKKRGQERK
jgi:hypothetical protein